MKESAWGRKMVTAYILFHLILTKVLGISTISLPIFKPKRTLKGTLKDFNIFKGSQKSFMEMQR